METSEPFRIRKRKGIFVLFMISGLFFISGIVMLLWNSILPSVLGVPALTYWQAMGIFALCRILFGSFRMGKHHAHHPEGKAFLHRKFMNMSEEERNAFREEWKSRCGG